MKVKELIEILKAYPDSHEVVFSTEADLDSIAMRANEVTEVRYIPTKRTDVSDYGDVEREGVMNAVVLTDGNHY